MIVYRFGTGWAKLRVFVEPERSLYVVFASCKVKEERDMCLGTYLRKIGISSLKLLLLTLLMHKVCRFEVRRNLSPVPFLVFRMVSAHPYTDRITDRIETS